MHQRKLAANNLALAHIARDAPLAETLACIIQGIENHNPEILIAILLLDEDGHRFHLGAAPSLAPDYLRAMEGCAADVELCAHQITAENIAVSCYWRSLRDLALQHGLHACPAVPILSATGCVLGIFLAHTKKTAPANDRHQSAIADVTALATIAIERHNNIARINRAEHALRENETRMALAIDGSGTGIWDRDVATGEIHYSARWKAILGYAETELTSRIEDSYTRVHPDDLALVQATIQGHFDQESEIYAVEHRIRCKDGTYKWISSRGKVVSRDAQGKPLRMLGTTTDITAMRALSDSLQQSVDLITSLTNEVPGLVYQYRLAPDGEAFFSYASAGIRDIYELTPEQVGADAALIHRIIHPDDFANYCATLAASAAGLTPWHLEYRVILPEQGLRWRQGHARPRRLPDGSTLWHGFITDITERRQAHLLLEQTRNQLLQSEKLVAIGQLAAGVAHEINSPIGFVSSNFMHLADYINEMLSLIAEYERGEPQLAPQLQSSIAAIRARVDIGYIKEDVPQLLAQSKDGIERVQKIIRSLRDFSRVDTAQEMLACDIHTGIESTLHIVWNELKHKVIVHKEFDRTLPEVECVGSQINQVILNLLINAAHSIDGTGDIWIRTGSERGQIYIEIADSGIGIAPEMQARIFEPFFTTKPVGQGTGLGLSVSYGIIQKHGGRIEVKSEPQRGTTFTIWLPVHYSPPA